MPYIIYDASAHLTTPLGGQSFFYAIRNLKFISGSNYVNMKSVSYLLFEQRANVRR